MTDYIPSKKDQKKATNVKIVIKITKNSNGMIIKMNNKGNKIIIILTS